MDLVSSPIQEILPHAVKTQAGTHAADVIILATGFLQSYPFLVDYHNE